MELFYVLDLIGTFAFAVSGVLAATQKKFDLFGAVVIGFVTAIGGGALRDMLIGTAPVSWMLDANYFYVIVAASWISFLFKNQIMKFRKTLFLFDTIGISVFTIVGLEKGLAAELMPMIAIIMGVISAVFGGVIRDVLCNEAPLIFREDIYATACFIGAILFMILKYAGIPEVVIVPLTMGVIMVVRTLAVKNHWHLPRHG